MNNSPLKWLTVASVINLVSNSLGIVLALQNNLISDLGGSIHGQNVFQDFYTTQGTAISAPLPFMVIQLALTVLASRSGRSRTVGVVGLFLVGLLYTPAQIGERIILKLTSPGGFNLAQFLVYGVNVLTAIAILVLSVWAWRTMRKPAPAG
jgi:hypothetical protein